MDFMKWLGSLDEFLYEVMSWVIFFPITLWRATVHPLATMALIEREASLLEEQQYAAVLSPPLFLALALLLGHSVATALGQTDAIIANQHGLAALVNDNASALAVRVIVFAAFPLFLAARLVRSGGASLDRSTLRRPFYEQCYPGAVFALGITMATSLSQVARADVQHVGQILAIGSITHFIVVETRWFSRQRAIGYGRALVSVLWALMQGGVLMLMIGFVLTR